MRRSRGPALKNRIVGHGDEAPALQRFKNSNLFAGYCRTAAPHSGVSGIYAILNVFSGRAYVGSAADIASRWRCHRKQLRRVAHGNKHLQAAWNVYGEECFRFVVLERVQDRNALLAREQEWLDDARFAGYNIRRIAHSNAGLKASAETRAKLSAARKGNKNSLGRKQPPEEIERRRRSLVGVKHEKPHPPWTPERRAAFALKMRGRPGKKGIPRPPEFRARVAATLRAFYASPDGLAILARRSVK